MPAPQCRRPNAGLGVVDHLWCSVPKWVLICLPKKLQMPSNFRSNQSVQAQKFGIFKKKLSLGVRSLWIYRRDGQLRSPGEQWQYTWGVFLLSEQRCVTFSSFIITKKKSELFRSQKYIMASSEAGRIMCSTLEEFQAGYCHFLERLMIIY